MFLDNKYTKVYYKLIERSKNRVISGYKEKHHIIPRSLGGGNDKENLTPLTAREHYIAHVLLVKMTTGSDRHKMLFAFSAMDNFVSANRYNSKLYENLRKECVVTMGNRNKQNKEAHKKISEIRKKLKLACGEKNPMFGRSAPKENNLKWYTDGTKDIYVTEGTAPQGFTRGRSSVKGNKNPLKNKETAMKLSKTRTTLQRNYLEDGSFTMVGRV
jgi:hypothetical protein